MLYNIIDGDSQKADIIRYSSILSNQIFTSSAMVRPSRSLYQM